MAKIAILGRPNVGKSTLFNRLVGRKMALVDDQPGVTRDRLHGQGRLGPFQFEVVDTAGLDTGAPGSLEARLRAQSEAALAEADLGLFLIDARTGIGALDRDIAAQLRRADKPILLIANKCEGRAAEALAAEAYALGLGDPIPISAKNAEGFALLIEALEPHLRQGGTTDTQHARDDDSEVEADGDLDTPFTGPLKLAIVGRPNVGKSSLVNRLLKTERLLTGPEPGLTRDAVTLNWTWQGREIALTDTAGLRKRARIDAALDKMSAGASIEALRRCHVAVLLLDARDPLEKQDATIGALAAREGRAVVVALNKWDLIDEPKKALDEARYRIDTRLPQLKGVTCLPLSVLTGRGLDKLLPAVIEAADRWDRRISTAQLNRWLHAALESHPPPAVQGHRVKIRYVTQIKTRPPTIALFGTRLRALPESYMRYLANSLREAFDLPGVPLRLRLRQGDNPYA
ncbi:MAG: ribosome biogenesis GTPase Der [Geminicoccaceae bacterium]